MDAQARYPYRYPCLDRGNRRLFLGGGTYCQVAAAIVHCSAACLCPGACRQVLAAGDAAFTGYSPRVSDRLKLPQYAHLPRGQYGCPTGHLALALFTRPVNARQ